jgi:hypothetical protein
MLLIYNLQTSSLGNAEHQDRVPVGSLISTLDLMLIPVREYIEFPKTQELLAKCADSNS